MTINILPALRSEARSPSREGPPSGGLLRLGEARPEERPWGAALLVAVLVHAAALGFGLVAGGRPSRPTVAAEEAPAVVLFRGLPRAAGPAAAPAPSRAQTPRQARARPARPAPVAPQKPSVPRALPSPAEVPPPVLEPAPQEPPAQVEAPGAVAPAGAVAAEGVGSVLGSVMGSVLGSAGGSAFGVDGDAPVEVSRVSRPPQLLERVPPRYPRQARRDGLEGRVVVRVILGTDGRVEAEHTRVVRSVPGLDEAAVDAIHRWRFSPAIGRSGRPVRVTMEVPVQFSLR